MNIIALNGSPKKNGNTAMLLEKALAGAASQGANTELVHLYDLEYKGCHSCFACKTRGGKSYRAGAMNDGLSPTLNRIREVDALILGSPIYFGTVSGEMKSLMERLLFPVLTDPDPPASLFFRKIHAGFIYTMNTTEEQMNNYSIGQHVALNESYLKRILGSSESLLSFDTYQFTDYSKVIADRFDPEKKAKRRKEFFPKDCEPAFAMGVRFIKSES
ncbi:MAG TPA: flavodoxin family protein [Nitrospirota bacterium]|nr:flavodoxin family protein [Nitrospirota bacterium]